MHACRLPHHEWPTMTRLLLGMAIALRLLGLLPQFRSPTAIGRSLENALGIEMNSSQLPDFKGIEIKAFRELLNNSKGTRVTLFACVPDWNLSFLKGSKDILEAFGY